MNVHSLIRMVIRQFLNRGISRGINHMSTGGRSREEMTPEERRQAKASRGQMQNTRRMVNVARRFMR